MAVENWGANVHAMRPENFERAFQVKNSARVALSTCVLISVQRAKMITTAGGLAAAIIACNGQRNAPPAPVDAAVTSLADVPLCSAWSDEYFSLVFPRSSTGDFHASDTMGDYLKTLQEPSFKARVSDSSYSYRLIVYAYDDPVKIVRIERRGSLWYRSFGQEVWSRASRPGELLWYEHEMSANLVEGLHSRLNAAGLLIRDKWESGGVDGTRYTFEVVGSGKCSLVSWSSANTGIDDPRMLLATEMLKK